MSVVLAEQHMAKSFHVVDETVETDDNEIVGHDCNDTIHDNYSGTEIKKNTRSNDDESDGNETKDIGRSSSPLMALPFRSFSDMSPSLNLEVAGKHNEQRIIEAFSSTEETVVTDDSDTDGQNSSDDDNRTKMENDNSNKNDEGDENNTKDINEMIRVSGSASEHDAQIIVEAFSLEKENVVTDDSSSDGDNSYDDDDDDHNGTHIKNNTRKNNDEGDGNKTKNINEIIQSLSASFDSSVLSFDSSALSIESSILSLNSSASSSPSTSSRLLSIDNEDAKYGWGVGKTPKEDYNNKEDSEYSGIYGDVLSLSPASTSTTPTSLGQKLDFLQQIWSTQKKASPVTRASPNTASTASSVDSSKKPSAQAAEENNIFLPEIYNDDEEYFGTSPGADGMKMKRNEIMENDDAYSHTEGSSEFSSAHDSSASSVDEVSEDDLGHIFGSDDEIDSEEVNGIRDLIVSYTSKNNGKDVIYDNDTVNGEDWRKGVIFLPTILEEDDSDGDESRCPENGGDRQQQNDRQYQDEGSGHTREETTKVNHVQLPMTVSIEEERGEISSESPLLLGSRSEEGTDEKGEKQADSDNVSDNVNQLKEEVSLVNLEPKFTKKTQQQQSSCFLPQSKTQHENVPQQPLSRPPKYLSSYSCATFAPSSTSTRYSQNKSSSIPPFKRPNYSPASNNRNLHLENKHKRNKLLCPFHALKKSLKGCSCKRHRFQII